jgi:UDP:flavonoid glycosyltransferase YjiC (YdhE family)
MVVGGVGQDKAVTNAIIQWKEVGVNLGKLDPSSDEIRDGILKVLGDNKYKRNAVAIKDAFGSYDMSVVFDRVIQGAVKNWAKEKQRG